jgi:pyrimidine-nucleoside phosphorylase
VGVEPFAMNFLQLIEFKRDGGELSETDIHSMILAYTRQAVPDYQMAALLMAIFFRGLTSAETRAFTFAMRDSGEVLQFPEDSRPIVDKHSTGGVGDKVSLPLAPLLACLGFRVPMISGRGLGITGGTLDKLESIPGFRTALTTREIIEQVQSIGAAFGAQTEQIVPADKAIYALRDVTATVPSIPLITASILSKKLAENLSALLLDVKCGRAAFMQTAEQARQLGQSIVNLGGDCGVRVSALVTDMDTPLGRAAGNWLEVVESVACLENRGPEDLRLLVIESAAHLLVETSRAPDVESARARAAESLVSGEPRRKWDEILQAQGADLDAFRALLGKDHLAPAIGELKSTRAGFVSQCDARVIGEAVRDLGGGRLKKDTVIDPRVGIDRLAKPGERVEAGTVLARVHAPDETLLDQALCRVGTAFQIVEEPVVAKPLVLDVMCRESSERR